MKSFRSIRLTAIASALALALPAAFAADATSPVVSKVSVGALSATQTVDRFIVTYRTGTTERSNASAVVQGVTAALSRAGMNKAQAGGVAPVNMAYKRKLAIGSDLVSTSRKLSPAEATTLMQQIAADPAVAHVEPDLRMRVVGNIAAPANAKPQTFTPNDQYYAKYQWHFSDPTGGANVNNAWDIADGTGVTVAVIDTGITQHPDLDLSLANAGYDFISDSATSGRATDGRAAGGWDLGDWTADNQCYSGSTGENSSWHGTHVSGTIAELTNNGTGMAGIAYNAKVLPVRALGHCGGWDSDISDAIVWASGGHVDGVPDNTNPAQVISMSLGGQGVCSSDTVTATAIASAISRGTTVVVAAGNDNDNVANYTPAGCPGVIAVAANGITGKRAFYSNYGAGITLSAPGGGVYTNDDPNTGTIVDQGFVWSSINSGTTVPSTATYGGMAGTSQATPHVSGTVAMILSATKAAGLPTPTPAAIKGILTSSARHFPVTPDKSIGAGILDAFGAVNTALGSSMGSDNHPIPLAKGVTLSGQSGNIGATLLYSFTVPAGATSLNIRSVGGTGDVSLFVKAGVMPADDGSDADFKSVKPGNNEVVTIAAPQATTYYIRITGVQAFSNVSLLATYAGP